MISYEAILQVSARMIAAIIFITSIGSALKAKVANWMFIFSIFGVLPFTVTAILAIMNNGLALWACIISFILFSGMFTIAAWALYSP